MNTHIAPVFSWLPTVYYIIMLLAIISSVVPGAFMVSSRWEKMIPIKDKSLSEKQVTKKRNKYGILIAAVYIVVCSAIALLGLDTVFNKGLTIVGYIGMPVVIIPICFVWPFLLHKRRKAKRLAAEAAKAEE